MNLIFYCNEFPYNTKVSEHNIQRLFKGYYLHFYICVLIIYYFTLKALIPGYTALSPKASSILNNWLYFATRSDLEGAPVLIWHVFNATAKSAIVVSAVSPER